MYASLIEDTGKLQPSVNKLDYFNKRLILTQLEVIYAPRCEGLGIDDLMALRARIAHAGGCADVLVDPELEALRMHIIRQFLDARRKSLEVAVSRRERKR